MLQTKLMTGVGAVALLLGATDVDAGEATPPQPAGAARAMSDAKGGPMAKLDPTLAALYRAHRAGVARTQGDNDAPQLQPMTPPVRAEDNTVMIDAAASGDVEELVTALRDLGAEQVSSYGRMVSAQVPVEALSELADLDSLQFARAAMATRNVGAVTSEGDPALNADLARRNLEVDGQGITVGVLSDSFDCLGGATDEIASGDLPPRPIVLDDSVCPDGIDEGRAMMQLIRDVAPGARQAFHTAFNGQADFANGILELADRADADIIVDDVIYFAEPMFQDGIIAQAVDAVEERGVAYFSSAGNNGRQSWDSGATGFVNSGINGVSGVRHDFDPGPGVADRQVFRLGTGTTLFVFQWDEPYFSVSGAPGAASDLDILIYVNGVFSGLGGFANNVGGDPVEVFGVVNSGPPANVEIAIEQKAGPAPELMKYVLFAPGVENVTDPPTSFPVTFATNSGTSYGHANAAGAVGVGAAFWRRTPRFGVTPPEIERFSSAGGVPILFDPEGEPIGPIVRQRPNVVGPDGGATTFFGRRDAFGNADPEGTNFFGTSASAPHVAAVAALMLEANPGLDPEGVTGILQDTALDMDDPATDGFDAGFDFGTGFGFVDARQAVDAATRFDADDADRAPLAAVN